MLSFARRALLKAIIAAGIIYSMYQIQVFTKDYVHEVVAAEILISNIDELNYLRRTQKILETGSLDEGMKRLDYYMKNETARLNQLCVNLEQEGKFHMKNEIKESLAMCMKFITAQRTVTSN